MINMYPEYDPYFIMSGCCKERREIFDRLWAQFKPYAVSHFLSQIRTQFHQRSWEMYVGSVLLEKKLAIKAQSTGPDFIVNESIYVECVAPTKGNPSNPDSVPEEFIATKPEEVRSSLIPDDQMILRITGAVKDKVAQYGKWKHKQRVDAKKPFVIAINTNDLGHGDNKYNPMVLRALFGLRHPRINLETGEVGFSQRAEITKSNKEAVPVNFFTRKDYSCVSGVIFSHTSVVNHPQDIGADCIFVNNPFADYPADESFVDLFKHWRAYIDNNVDIVLQFPQCGCGDAQGDLVL